MTRLLLLILLALVTWFYFPETRTMLLDIAEPIVVPVVRWSSEEEMKQLGRNVVEHERLTGQVPAGAGWLGWLEYRYTSDDIYVDPWSSVYQLVIWPDSVGILSLGPDRIRATEDDFYIATRRQ